MKASSTTPTAAAEELDARETKKVLTFSSPAADARISLTMAAFELCAGLDDRESGVVDRLALRPLTTLLGELQLEWHSAAATSSEISAGYSLGEQSSSLARIWGTSRRSGCGAIIVSVTTLHSLTQSPSTKVLCCGFTAVSKIWS